MLDSKVEEPIETYLRIQSKMNIGIPRVFRYHLDGPIFQDYWGDVFFFANFLFQVSRQLHLATEEFT